MGVVFANFRIYTASVYFIFKNFFILSCITIISYYSKNCDIKKKLRMGADDIVPSAMNSRARDRR